MVSFFESKKEKKENKFYPFSRESNPGPFYFSVNELRH